MNSAGGSQTFKTIALIGHFKSLKKCRRRTEGHHASRSVRSKVVTKSIRRSCGCRLRGTRTVTGCASCTSANPKPPPPRILVSPVACRGRRTPVHIPGRGSAVRYKVESLFGALRTIRLVPVSYRKDNLIPDPFAHSHFYLLLHPLFLPPPPTSPPPTSPPPTSPPLVSLLLKDLINQRLSFRLRRSQSSIQRLF